MPQSTKKYVLPDSEIPEQWYNIVADLPNPPPPPLNPATLEPIGPDALGALFPPALIAQEVSGERFIPIPDRVRHILQQWRPSPLIRATAWEQVLDTPAHIYFKYEGVSPAGSHKPNTAVAQAYYNHEAGIRRLTTETGAGQWGSALALACNYFDLECRVYMVRVSYEQKPFRRSMMQVWGGEVVASPSEETQAGRQIRAQDPESPGSLGIAISEAVEVAASREDTNYALGSVLNHVLLHQTVIGQEAIKQMEMAGEYPDVVIGCAGGGSNFAGLAFPLLRARFDGSRATRFLAAEPAACPSLTHGEYRYDFGDTAGTTPLMKMHTLGHGFIPPGIHAGGLRYHGMAPLLSQLVADGHIEAAAFPQTACFATAIEFSRAEGIIPAPESSHALQAAREEALAARDAGEPRVILFNLSGHGHFDLGAYDRYLAGELEDYAYPEAAVREAMEAVPVVG